MPRVFDICFRVKEKQLGEAVEWASTFGVVQSLLPVTEDTTSQISTPVRRSPRDRRIVAVGNDMLAINTSIKPKFQRPNSKIKSAYEAIKKNFNGAVFSRREAEEFLRKHTPDKTIKQSTNRMTHMLIKGYIKKVKNG